jgi:phage terminase large subunit GpA-like protein
VKHVIHIHQANMRMGEPAIIDRTYKGSTHHRQLGILCPHCDEIAAVVTQSDVPDRCGARVWIDAERTFVR